MRRRCGKARSGSGSINFEDFGYLDKVKYLMGRKRRDQVAARLEVAKGRLNLRLSIFSAQARYLDNARYPHVRKRWQRGSVRREAANDR